MDQQYEHRGCWQPAERLETSRRAHTFRRTSHDANINPPKEPTTVSITPPASTPIAADYVSQHQLLDRCVVGDWREQSLADMRQYFRDDGPAEALYSGRRFERLAGGGDTAAVRDVITPADVLALTFLSITDRLPAVTIDVTETYADRITKLLTQLPTDLAMHQAPWEHYAAGSPAFELWTLLCRCGGKQRWVMAHKLSARKRPHLLPVYDNEVATLLQRPKDSWACLWTWLHDNPKRPKALSELRDEVSGIADISLLRCLDVVLWMRATR
ncbi:DUF6308 family protein [Amycolatopsis alkalitolerans]|uniref:Uncharacterized protein n=1 Tax=Amycolatopsis alkalitolerans TaxID=2547244 RepID=A0A5C4LYG3_9PSEU|nr:DUF6308 family protein [Amycolatopsis alkalitolerans]TNC23743.1 hypothetical protein FG385_20495 [Amycolatopsis alkalitolerans]